MRVFADIVTVIYAILFITTVAIVLIETTRQHDEIGVLDSDINYTGMIWILRIVIAIGIWAVIISATA